MTAEGVTPDLSEVILAAVDSRLLDLHTMIPVKVEAYDATRQTVDVVPQIRRVLELDTGKLESEKLPKLGNVPVAFYRSGGSYISLPIKRGDHGMILCAEVTLDQWRQQGGVQAPGDIRRHSLAGAVFYPGLYPDNQKLDDLPSDAAVFAGDEIRMVSPTGSDPVISESVLRAVLAAGAAAGGPAGAAFGLAITNLNAQILAKTFKLLTEDPA